MQKVETPFKDLYILEPKVMEDARGYFMESYNHKSLIELGINTVFVQDNQSLSAHGVLRGLHFQNAPYAHTKLVRVLSGVIQDVVVDLRREQDTFGKYFSIELSATNKKQLLVPKGFAHGFLVLSQQAEILYKCDQYYSPDYEGGIRFDDPVINISWQLSSSQFILSSKDRVLPFLSEAKFTFL
jgi:dTDP-4-dehydrorhamnose 3,5-epimerase